MTRYLISFDAHAMDHIPATDMPAVGAAAHAVLQEAVDAGVWVVGAGLDDQVSSIVGTNGAVSVGAAPQAVGGFAIVDVGSRGEAEAWAAKIAAACRCAQEVFELMNDPDQERMIAASAGHAGRSRQA
jgi:hypothetical protein